MKKTLLAATLAMLYSVTALCQEPTRAKTDAGREVVLNADGTWKYATESAPKSPVSAGFNKSVSARKLFKPDRGNFTLWYDDTKWQMSLKPDEPGSTTFTLKRGDGYGVFIVEELGMPLASLKRIALSNAKEAAPDAKIVFEETRVVNGKELLCMKIDGTIEEIPFRFYGYYYAGKEGTVQLLTYTGQSLFEKYEQDFLAFINGLEIG